MCSAKSRDKNSRVLEPSRKEINRKMQGWREVREVIELAKAKHGPRSQMKSTKFIVAWCKWFMLAEIKARTEFLAGSMRDRGSRHGLNFPGCWVAPRY